MTRRRSAAAIGFESTPAVQYCELCSHHIGDQVVFVTHELHYSRRGCSYLARGGLNRAMPLAAQQQSADDNRMNSCKTDLDKPPHKPANILLRLLGPGLVTGAANDDPSGIATYSQAGAQFGYALLWTVFLTTPFMIAIQLVSAQIGRVTGKGIIANVRDFAPAGW